MTDFTLAAAFGSVLDLFAAGGVIMGVIIGVVVAIAWIKSDI